MPNVLIARPEAPLFFGNADAIFAAIRARIEAQRGAGLRAVVLSMEESPTWTAPAWKRWPILPRRCGNGTCRWCWRGPRTPCVNCWRVDMAALPASAYAAWSVDDAVAALNDAGESETASAG